MRQFEHINLQKLSTILRRAYFLKDTLKPSSITIKFNQMTIQQALKPVLTLSIGESFAEMTSQNKVQRWYIPSSPTHTQIRSFINKLSEESQEFKNSLNNSSNQSQFLVSIRRPEKILKLKTGSTIAQIVTRGFEDWTYLRQGPIENEFHLTPQRCRPLTTNEITFGLSERISTEGKVIEPLNHEELDGIAKKLKLMEIKRVAVNLLNAHKNSEHLNAVCEKLKSEGLEVFSHSPHPEHWDEVALWRRNLLNGFLGGTIAELRDEVYQGCEGLIPRENIKFLNCETTQDSHLGDLNLAYIYGFQHSLQKLALEKKSDHFLYFGLEKFIFVNSNKNNINISTPWGLCELNSPDFKYLRIQPSQTILLNQFEDLEINTEEDGFEPGPMIMGRAQKPMLFDLYCKYLETKNIDEIKISESGAQRFDAALLALVKRANGFERMDLEKAKKEIYYHSINLIAQEIELKRTGNKILCGGFFAKPFVADLKKLLPHIQLEEVKLTECQIISESI